MWHKVILLEEGTHKSWNVWLYQKVLGPFGILYIEAPQTKSYELSSAKWVLPG